MAMSAGQDPRNIRPGVVSCPRRLPKLRRVAPSRVFNSICLINYWQKAWRGRRSNVLSCARGIIVPKVLAALKRRQRASSSKLVTRRNENAAKSGSVSAACARRRSSMAVSMIIIEAAAPIVIEEEIGGMRREMLLPLKAQNKWGRERLKGVAIERRWWPAVRMLEIMKRQRKRDRPHEKLAEY